MTEGASVNRHRSGRWVDAFRFSPVGVCAGLLGLSNGALSCCVPHCIFTGTPGRSLFAEMGNRGPARRVRDGAATEVQGEEVGRVLAR